MSKINFDNETSTSNRNGQDRELTDFLQDKFHISKTTAERVLIGASLLIILLTVYLFSFGFSTPSVSSDEQMQLEFQNQFPVSLEN